MRKQTILALFLAAALAVPAAAAAPTPTAQTATADAGGSSSASDAASATNYTSLYVDAEGTNLDLKPGESDSFSLTVENGDESAVSLSPHLYVPPVGENLLKAEWVSIDGDTELDDGEETSLDVTVSVPESAELGHYRGQIALTNETVTYPGRPARPVHAVSTYVEVWKQPAVEILSSTYFSGQVEAGDSATYEVRIENSAESAVPLSPELKDQRNVRYGGSTGGLDPSWVSIDAPPEIDAGETATVEMTVSVPESAERGSYDAQVDLGLKDPNRPGRSTYWQEVDLGVQVWKQPAEPFETTFDVSEDAESIDLTLSPRTAGRERQDAEAPDFDVTLVTPNGTEIAPERVRTTNEGYVDMSGRSRQAQTDGAYASDGSRTSFDYTASASAAGEWTLRVMPHNTMGFNYEIVRNESA